jgi:hypothetical protein
MKRMLLAAAGSVAAIALSAGGAQAQQWSGHRSDGRFVGQSFNCGEGVRDGTVIAAGNADGDHRRGGGMRRGCNSNVVMDWYGGEWARWNNRTWEPTSYNDWWHEEPWRAYPAWMRHNQDCQRQWFSGDTLRC